MNEQWKPVSYAPGYEISNVGNVRSSKRGTPRLLKPGVAGTNGEYGQVALMIDGKRSNRLVHRLVLEAFVGPCPEGMEARHINGDASDNRVENLEWSTHMDNMQDKVAHGTLMQNRACGESTSYATLTADQVREIRSLYEAGGVTQKALADKYNTSRANIGLIVNRKNWKQV
jgi:hypothetical protein